MALFIPSLYCRYVAGLALSHCLPKLLSLTKPRWNHSLIDSRAVPVSPNSLADGS